MIDSSLKVNLLAIDIGNTRIKWGLFDANGVLLKNGYCLNTSLATLDLPAADHVQISNVAGNAIKLQLEIHLTRYSNVNWLKSTSQICGVFNRYTNPETLGCDRWAALIAAWEIKQAPCVVVNAGTAVTIDALSSNHHQAAFIGGLILPGLNLMQQSLGQSTAQLPANTSDTSTVPLNKDIFPKNTIDAIHTGALQAITGAITLMSYNLHAECKQLPYILISGGNAQAIKDSLMSDVTKQALVVDHLVLRGLYLIDKFMQSEHAI